MRWPQCITSHPDDHCTFHQLEKPLPVTRMDTDDPDWVSEQDKSDQSPSAAFPWERSWRFVLHRPVLPGAVGSTRVGRQ
jgi:hypothetical protein